MKKMKLKYDDKSPNIKGSIARMIVNRKCEITKVINKRAEKSHQKTIISKRNKSQIKDQRNQRRSKCTFSVSGNNTWYMRDGSVCDGSKATLPPKFNSQFYLERIKELEEKLVKKEKVIY